MNYPTIKINDAGRQVVETFGGLNRSMKIREGEWSETTNLSSDNYPLLSTRKTIKATDYGGGTIYGMIDHGGLWLLRKTGNVFSLETAVNTGEQQSFELQVTTQSAYVQMISMGAYIIIPQMGIWVNTADGTQGSIDAGMTAPTQDITAAGMTHPYVMKLCPCDAEGNELRIVALASEENAAKIENGEMPGMVADGECYAVGSKRLIRRYLPDDAEKWQTQEHYLRVDAAGIGDGIEAGDYVTLSGVSTAWAAENGVYVQDMAYEEMDPLHQPYGNTVGKYDDDANGTREVAAVGTDYIVLKGVFFTRRVTLNETAAASADTGRHMPDMDFVVEAQNRLWGCKYGFVDGELINEIYASALGDFRNWRKYDATSMASWAASVGTPGPWTGAISYNGCPLFFKENSMHKVTPSAYGAHQIREYAIDGVKDGCSRTLCYVDGRVYWVGKFAIYAYDGSLPASRISGALGLGYVEDVAWAYAAGANKHIFFSMMQESGADVHGAYYVYDVTHQAWNKINAHYDGKQLMSGCYFCASGNGVYASLHQQSNVGADEVWDLLGNYSYGSSEEDTIEWTCTSGLIGYEDVEQKYMSRFVLRAMLAQGSKMDVYVEYDSDGKWIHAGGSKGTTGRTTSFVLPMVPCRCDHFRIRLSGKGEMALYSLSKKYQKGSDVK